MSLASNLYALGALMKDNLEYKGITGLTGNEGLTTLANKIRDITCKKEEENALILTVTGDSFTLGSQMLYTGQVNIDWGDETVETNVNPNGKSHTYTDGESSHIISITGEITSLGQGCFNRRTGLTSVTIPNSVITIGGGCFSGCSSLASVTIPNSITNIGEGCFWGCSSLTSVTIPDSVITIGNSCFYDCSGLIDYELYWTGEDIITYSSSKMPNNTDTVFTIPVGTTQLYIDAGYPSAKLRERHEYELYVTRNKEIIQANDNLNLVAMLLMDGEAAVGETLTYQIIHDGSIVDSGSGVTDDNGLMEITHVSTGIGELEITVKYGILEKTYTVEDWIAYKPSEVTGTSGEYITIADLSNIDLPGRFILSFDYKTNYESRVGLFSKNNFSGNPNYSVFVGKPEVADYWYYGFRTTTTNTLDIPGSPSEYSHYVIERYGNTFKYSRGGRNWTPKSISWFDNYDYIIGMMQWGTDGEHSVKNVQMVALPDVFELNVVGDKDIIQSSETATITVTLTKNGVAVSGETLSYTIENGIGTMTRTITTGNDGTATIVYTGTGVGEVNITVEYGTLLQETYEVYDCLAYDKGTLAKHNDIWLNTTQSGVNFERKEEYTEFAITTSGNKYIPLNLQLNSQNMVIEFDVLFNTASTGAFADMVYQGSRISQINLQGIGGEDNVWIPVKLVLNDGSITVINKNTSQSKVLAENSNWDSFRFLNYSAIDKTTSFKNFKVYSI